MHSETADGGSVMGQFGLIGQHEFEYWYENYSSFLDQFDEYHGWRRACHKREDKELITSIYKLYLRGVNKILTALLERQARRQQRGDDKDGDEDGNVFVEADSDLEKNMDNGEKDILIAERYLRS